MSLKVWLPLNGDLENKGTSNVNITANGATVNTSGKIGSCYSFDGSDDYISLDCSDLYSIIKGGTQPFSITFWVYHADSTRAIIFGDYGLSGTINFNIELTTGHTVRFYWGGSPDKNFSTTVAAAGWTHIALVYDGTSISIYKDGIKQSDSYSGTLATKTKTSGVYYLGRDNRTGATVLNGRLNDFRIYDHALSALEVKEISQALILHYKLDDPYSEPTINLAAGIAGNSLVSFNVATYATLIKNNTLYGNNVYTYRLYIKNTSDHSLAARISAYNANDSTSTTTIGNYIASGEEGYSSVTVDLTNTSNWSGKAILYVQNGNSGVVPTNKTFYVKEVQMEQKDHATPYTDGTRNNTIIQDSSGYNHNGTSINNIELSSSSPHYNNCLFLNATNKKIKCGVLNVTGFNQSFTIAWWGKCSSFSGKMMWGFSDGIRLNGIYNGNLWNTGDGTSNPLYTPGTTTQVSAPSTNVWHHFAMTGNGTKHYVYLDGELWAEAKNYKLLSGTQIYINGWDSGTSYSNDNLSMSDFRIYATPLLDNDIKSLYNVGMKIDNLSNIHTSEFNEEDQNVLAGIPWTSPFTTHSATQNIFTNYNSNGEPQFTTNNTSAGSQYIEITPGTYYYDLVLSVNSGNQFYVGFERYDANKTARENNACAYVYTTKPTSNVVKQRYKGTVNLSTDGVNTLKYITLRVLNGWSGTTSGVTGQATIHHLSLRPVTGAHSPKLKNTGQLDLSELKEYSKSSFYQNRLVEAAEFIER